ncbi:hypothetical protein AXF21_07430 [Eubacterium minutum ATCC 700079]|nr:hypothetical protein AXF21_07430 [Eubacterium minutum ATCC 700079]
MKAARCKQNPYMIRKTESAVTYLTQKALAESLKKLLNRKTLNKITVSDITNDCGVNRQTFYYHFHDVYELVDWIFAEEMKRYAQEGFTPDNWRDVMTRLMDNFLEERHFIINVYNSLNRKELEKYMRVFVKPAVTDIVNEIARNYDVSAEDIDFLTSTLTASLTGIVAEWIGGGMDPSYRLRLDKFFVLLDGMVEYILQKFEKSGQNGSCIDRKERLVP